jgi:hypothetical protein
MGGGGRRSCQPAALPSRRPRSAATPEQALTEQVEDAVSQSPRSPPMTAAGSPSARCMRLNTNSAMTAITTTGRQDSSEDERCNTSTRTRPAQSLMRPYGRLSVCCIAAASAVYTAARGALASFVPYQPCLGAPRLTQP